MSEKERTKILAGLSDEDKAVLYYQWARWARPNQLPPDGDWRVWLILAGRGYGKTRTGAEWVRAQMESGRCRRMAAIAPTAADVRDVMVEGESGLMAVCPPWNRPLYEPSKRRLTWPNGGLVTCYSADEPERARGPQHDGLWADEIACLIAGTRINTENGPCPIEDVPPGTRVMTRDGWRRVKHCWQTSAAARVVRLTSASGRVIAGTPEHRFWVVGQGWKPLSLIGAGDILEVWKQPLNGEEERGISTPKDTTRTGTGNSCTERFTSAIMASFRRAWTFITGTRISRTTIPTTWRRLPDQSISSGIPVASPNGPRASGERYRLRVGAQSQQGSIIAPSAARSSTQRECEPSSVISTARWLSIAGSMRCRLKRSALAVAPPSGHSSEASSSARCNVPSSPSAGHRQLVPSVGGSSRSATLEPSAAHDPVDTSSDVVREAVTLGGLYPVYDLEIEGTHEYYANGFLVHNSWRYPEAWDQFMFGLRLGKDPRATVTTTPKPIALVKELLASPTTQVTRGTSYENRMNLAPAFFAQIVKKYEGTRLGRQELLAEVLDDNPNALWTRAMIESSRVSRHPELERVIVAVDPAVTNDEGSSETGIVVAGVAGEQFFVLEDRTLRASPRTWAAEAVTAYHSHKADRVVGEVNNGGDMIEHTIRTVDANVSYKKVTATRGKALRAEPIAALYEQGRVHHVGTFPQLEDQMAEWEPGMDSPDRLDALVWALTELSEDPGYMVVAVAGPSRGEAWR